MKTFAICTITLGIFTLAAFGQGSDAIARQRAKNLANQNNNRPVDPATPPGATPAMPAKPAPTPAPGSLAAPVTQAKPNQHQQNIAKLKVDVTRIHTEHKVTDQSKQEFSHDLLSVAQGTTKPSPAAISKLADDLLPALAASSVTTAADEKLVQRLVVLVNSGGLSTERTHEISEETQTALQSAGVSPADASKVAGDLQAIAADVRPAAAKL
jgi:hypothetical protein